ncbi:GIY-YIG nuclease family protein [Flavobacterium sp. XS2P14]|uniref:GIY-YIG nuclease family protein n=2 Tax=unclassified Flavobacterium TaxID=196869 RepID=UPI003AACF358
MFYVYILFSKSRDMYYIGSNSMVIEERLRSHLSAHKGFTARAKDWEVVYSELFDQKSLAIAREQEIKKWKSKAKIEALISK